MKQWLAAILVLVSVLVLCACNGERPAVTTEPVKPTEPAEPAADFQGLVLKAPSKVAIILYSGFKEGAAVMPTETCTEAGYTYRCYAGLEGAYRYQSVCPGYYTTTKNVVVEPEDNQKRTLVEVVPEKMAGNGWEPDEVSLFADTLVQGAFSDDISQWPEYADAFTTPWFTQSHAAHQMTTQDQLEEYLRSLDDGEDDLYLYSAGTGGTYSQNIPLVVLTTEDLSGADTLEKMALALDNGKPTILYRGQIHGNEPAGGEAALAVITLLDGKWGHYLDQMNVCVIPRGNPDSAKDFYRNVGATIDPNRDSLQIKTMEVAAFQKLSMLLLPSLIIDSHEYQAHTDTKTIGDDILVGVGYTTESTAPFRELGMELADRIFGAVKEQGMVARFYEDYINSINAAVSRAYASHQGTPFILIESRGIGIGTQLYARRIFSHVVSVESLLTYVGENGKKLMDTAAAERDAIIRSGSVYGENNRITLESGVQPVESRKQTVSAYDQMTGQRVDVTVTPKERGVIARDVAPPTAYVIPAGMSFTSGVLQRMEQHDIAYTFIPEGSTVLLRQYGKDSLLEENAVTFPEGAYVMCRNQIQGRILCQLMEPQVPDHGTSKSTLVNQGAIPKLEGGEYPLYGYVHDLNGQGFIDIK